MAGVYNIFLSPVSSFVLRYIDAIEKKKKKVIKKE